MKAESTLIRTFAAAAAMLLLPSASQGQGMMDHLERRYTITVDYAKSLADMVREGKYDDVDTEVKGRAEAPRPTRGRSTVDVRLFQFSEDLLTEDILKRLDGQGMRPATLEELLALGAAFPDLAADYGIVALGTVHPGQEGSRWVPTLFQVPYEGRSRRGVLFKFAGGNQPKRWFIEDNYRFAAVRKADGAKK